MSEDLFDTSESETLGQNNSVVSVPDPFDSDTSDLGATVASSDVSTTSPEPSTFAEQDADLERQEATDSLNLDLSTKVKSDAMNYYFFFDNS